MFLLIRFNFGSSRKVWRVCWVWKYILSVVGVRVLLIVIVVILILILEKLVLAMSVCGLLLKKFCRASSLIIGRSSTFIIKLLEVRTHKVEVRRFCWGNKALS
jgi:hypothetical protein